MPRLTKKQQDEVRELFEKEYYMSSVKKSSNEIEVSDDEVLVEENFVDKNVQHVVNWEALGLKAKNMKNYTPKIKEGFNSVIKFVNLILCKEFKSEGACGIFVIALIFTLICIGAWPLSIIGFIWDESFPIFKVMATSFLVGSFTALIASLAFISDEEF